MTHQSRFCCAFGAVLAVLGMGCASSNREASPAFVWQEGERVTSSREGVAKVADTDKKPASSGAVLYGQVLSPKGARASWQVNLPESIEEAQIVFRYGRLHWRAEMKPAVFELAFTRGTQTIRREIRFGPTRGWGTKPGDFDLLRQDLGAMANGQWTMTLTSLADVNDISLDGFWITRADLKISAAELNAADRIAIDAEQYVGVSAPAIVHQGGTPTLKVLRRSFVGKPNEVRTQIRQADDPTKTWPLGGAAAPSTQPAKVTNLSLPSGLKDGNYELLVEDASRNLTLAMPVTLAGELMDKLDARVQYLQGFASSLAGSGDPSLAALKPTVDHIIQFILANQRALSDTSGDPAAATNLRRLGLADQEGAVSVTPSLQRLRSALDQAEQIAGNVEAKRPPFGGRTGDFRLAYRSAVDGRLAIYRLYVPSTYDQQKQLPAILFLHGGGGDENYWPELADGQILRILEERGYIGIMPHWNRRAFGEHWMADQLQLLDEVTRLWPKVDPDRVYLTGISMGGGGTFRLAVAHPERFAAICCVSGPGDTEQAPNLKLPIMIIHGEADTVSPADRAIKMNQTLVELRHPVRFHLYPKHGHNYHAELYLRLTLDFFAEHRRKLKE
jgi:pimeloyl-ACP methyl ester carboxylesterase